MAKNITICIPVYEQGGLGYEFLKRSLEALAGQTYQDFDVIVSDNSTYFAKDKMKKICDAYPFVTYVHNPIKGMSENTNFAMKHATGNLVKVLYQDDWLPNENALKTIVDNFDDNTHWLITGANTNPQPRWTDDIITGNNKLGSPSALTMRRESMMYFDEPMKWLLDCDIYRRLHDKYGMPKIVEGDWVTLGIGEHQMTNILSNTEKDKEVEYLRNKYDNRAIS